MDTTCAQNSPLRIPGAKDRNVERISHAVGVMARKIGGVLAALNVTLGRRRVVVPGMSDRSVARLAMGEHHEDVVRWYASAYQYGGKQLKRL